VALEEVVYIPSLKGQGKKKDSGVNQKTSRPHGPKGVLMVKLNIKKD
jgi:hypothetical protein